jgi:hypothetical protein
MVVIKSVPSIHNIISTLIVPQIREKAREARKKQGRPHGTGIPEKRGDDV